MCRNTVFFCDVFSTRGSKCIGVCLIFTTCSSQSKPARNTGICSVLTRQHVKRHDVCEAIVRIFSSPAPQLKKQSLLALFLPPRIPTQQGVKSQNIAKIQLKWTSCLSQSFPQSSNSKNWGRLSGPQNDVNYSFFYGHTMHFTCKKVAPQLKLTCC